MIAAVVIRKGDTLVPVDAGQAALIEEMPEGKPIRVTMVSDRGHAYHNAVWGIIGLCAKALSNGIDHWTTNALRGRIQAALGYADVFPASPAIRARYPNLPKGGLYLVIPQSLAFDKMPAAEFRRFGDGVMETVSDLAPWIMDAPEWRRIQDVLVKFQVEPRQ